MDHNLLASAVDDCWETSILPALEDYIRIPNKSPLFDGDWAEHGHMADAVRLLSTWARAQDIAGLDVEIVELPGRTPLLFAEIDGANEDTVLLYGHYDKQPEFEGWEPDLSPWTPVRRDGKLYGRGGADDGYALFGSLTAIRMLQEQGIPHGRCVVLIEGCEESGSFDLPFYVEALKDRIGSPSLVVCLDAECGDYDRLWGTTSLRGNLTGTLSVEVLREGVHSGSASGIVPSSFRILRSLIERVEDSTTGELLAALGVEIPADRLQQAAATSALLGDGIFDRFPFVPGMRPVASDPSELVLNSTWRPTLSVTGADGIPAVSNAGNTLRPATAVKLSFRLPPTADAERAAAFLCNTFESDPPYGSTVRFEVDSAAPGWNAPAFAPWLAESLQAASAASFQQDAAYMGTGGTIPFMNMLGEAYPGVQFLVTGLLGPNSNAHGPNEFLHIETGKRLTACVARVLADHHRRE